MNILFTTPAYHPLRGGAESLIEDLARSFVSDGHRVTVLTSRPDPSLPARERREGVEVIRLAYPPQAPRTPGDVLLTIRRSASMALGLWRVIARRDIDTLCVGLVGLEAFFVVLLGRLLPFRLVVYLHGGELRSYVRISRLMRWTLRRCLRRCHAAIAVSDALRQEAVAFAPFAANKIFVLQNAVDVEAIRRAPRYRHARPYVLYAGRLLPAKGVETLIRAYALARDELREHDLLVAGAGPAAAGLREVIAECRLEERVHLLGIQDRECVFSLLQGCELVVLPSRAEGCPLILLEALAAGKMAIAARVAGIGEILDEGVTGVLFEPDDAAHLAELLARYVAHPELRAPLEERVGHTDLTRFDLGRAYARHLRIYRGLEGPLTVALVSFFFAHDENCTGVASYYATLFEALRESGHDVHLITTRDGPSPQAADRVVRVPLSRRHLVATGSGRGSGSPIRVAARLLFSLLAYRRLRTLQRRRGLDVVVAPELFAPGLWAALAMGRKVMTRVHTPSYVGDAYNERHRWRWIGKLVSLPERVQTRRSAAVSVASSGLARVVARDWRLPSERIHIVPNAVPLDWIRGAGQGREKVIPGGYLLYFGRLERRKGVHVISRALPRILRSVPDLKMVFIGRDCGWKATIASENADLADRLLWYDTMPRPELFGAIRHATLVLLPSLFDNLSNALLETMALGRPVVATYGTGAEEIIQDGINGFLVEPGDADALAAKTVACLQGADLAAVGRKAFTSIERLDARAIVPRYVELFRAMRSAR